MTLTVRLDAALADALERYCREQGITKSLVVQQSLAAYLVHADAGGASDPQPARSARRLGAAFLAFQRAGLLASGALAGGRADKAAVRRRIAERASGPTARRAAAKSG